MPEQYIGIDLGGTNIRAGWISGDDLIHFESMRIDSLESEEEILGAIFELAERHPSEQVRGVGIGVPGVVDTAKGTVYNVQNLPGWEEVPLKSILEERLRLPVRVNSDANCFALGEYHFGRGKPFDSMIGLTIGTGFAGGIILNGRLYEGRNGGAGEFGTLPFKSSTLEEYCAGHFFDREHKTTGEKLFAKAERGDLRARVVFEEFGRYLGFAMKMILYCYDPEAIILGGSVSKSYPFYEQSMMAELEDFAFPKTIENLTVSVSRNEHAGVMGAAALWF